MLWGHLDSTGAPCAKWDFVAFFFFLPCSCSSSSSSLVWLVASRILFWVSGEKWHEPKPLPGRRSVYLCRFFRAQLQLWAVSTTNGIGTLSIAHSRCHPPALSTHSPSALPHKSEHATSLRASRCFARFPLFYPTRHQKKKNKLFLNFFFFMV